MGTDAAPRILSMDSYYQIADQANAALPPETSLRLNNFEWAIMTALDKAALVQCWSGVGVAIGAVFCVLLFALPVHRVVTTSVNIGLVVFCTIGYMGYSGQS